MKNENASLLQKSIVSQMHRFHFKILRPLR